MNIEEMIAVLEAAKRGEKIEMLSVSDLGDGWGIASTPQWNFSDFDYRIAPKQMTLVEELRMATGWDRGVAIRAADRLEELERHAKSWGELIHEIKRRMA